MAPLLKAAETMESITKGCISASNDALSGENYLSHHQSEAALCGGLSHLAVREEGQRDHQGPQTAPPAAVCHTVLEHLVLQHQAQGQRLPAGHNTGALQLITATVPVCYIISCLHLNILLDSHSECMCVSLITFFCC